MTSKQEKSSELVFSPDAIEIGQEMKAKLSQCSVEAEQELYRIEYNKLASMALLDKDPRCTPDFIK